MRNPSIVRAKCWHTSCDFSSSHFNPLHPFFLSPDTSKMRRSSIRIDFSRRTSKAGTTTHSCRLPLVPETVSVSVLLSLKRNQSSRRWWETSRSKPRRSEKTLSFFRRSSFDHSMAFSCSLSGVSELGLALNSPYNHPNPHNFHHPASILRRESIEESAESLHKKFPFFLLKNFSLRERSDKFFMALLKLFFFASKLWKGESRCEFFRRWWRKARRANKKKMSWICWISLPIYFNVLGEGREWGLINYVTKLFIDTRDRNFNKKLWQLRWEPRNWIINTEKLSLVTSFGDATSSRFDR